MEACTPVQVGLRTGGDGRNAVWDSGGIGMCRNIHVLFNFEPPATAEEVRAAALQYVRKVSGYARPSAANAEVFELAVDKVTQATAELLDGLVTAAPARDRDVEIAKARERARRRFGEAQ